MCIYIYVYKRIIRIFVQNILFDYGRDICRVEVSRFFADYLGFSSRIVITHTPRVIDHHVDYYNYQYPELISVRLLLNS